MTFKALLFVLFSVLGLALPASAQSRFLPRLADDPFRPAQPVVKYETIRAARVTPIAVQNSVLGRVFHVTAFGAKGDGTTNDTPAIMKAVAAVNANGGSGIVEFPSGTFLLTPGNPASDSTNFMVTGSAGVMLNFTATNSTVRLSPATTIKVVASYLCQNAAGQFASCTQTLFGTSASPLANFRIQGNGGKITWATDTENGSGSSAARVTVLNGANEFYFLRGSYRDPEWRDFETQDFPRNIALDGGYTDGSGNTLTDARVSNCKFTNYGGAGHDLNSYWQGGNTVTDCLFESHRQWASHEVYLGAAKIGNRFVRCKFKRSNADASLTNKYALQSYSEGGSGDVAGLLVEDCDFEGWIAAVLVQHANISVSGKVVRDVQFVRCKFTGDGTNTAMAMVDPNDCSVAYCTFDNYLTGISATNGTVSGSNFTVIHNKFKTVKNWVITGSAIADSHVTDNYGTTPIVGGVLFNCQGKRGHINRNHAINAGGSGTVGFYIAGDGTEAVGNEIFTDNSVAYTELFDFLSGAGWTFAGNVVNSNASGYSLFSGSDFKIIGNTFSERTIVAAGATGNNLVSENIFNGSRGKPEMRGTANFINNVAINGPYVATGSDAAGFKNARGNTWNSSNLIDTVIANATGTYTPHTNLYAVFALTLTGNTTIAASETTPTDGRAITFILTEDGVGGRTITWNSQYIVSCTLSTGANVRNTVSFIYNATLGKYVQTGCTTGL